ncbi:UNVERIFIED_CONTAM: hypothetical protein HDU68_006355 [Siphonaria sp. JEL0065]|nr:hypothetical protein HDU68_006355 [Siphonaria sp. JEL0065]
MNPTATTASDARIFGAIQRRDSEQLAIYLAELDAAMPAASLDKAASQITTATAYSGLVSGDIDIVKALLANKQVDPSMLDNGALIANTEAGRTEIVGLLLQDPRVDPLAEDGKALVIAAAHHNETMFQSLITRIPASKTWDPTLPLAIAARNGSIKIADLIVNTLSSKPTPEQRVRINMALVFAAEKGVPDIVKAILSIKDVNPKFSNDAAYLVAFKNSNTEAMQLLLETGRVKHEDHFADSYRHPMIDLELADPKWWVPLTTGALKFYSQVVNLQY